MKNGFLVFSFFLFTFSLIAQKDIEITSLKVTDNIYMLVGAGGNIGVFIGPEGIVMIDDQFAPFAPKIKAAINSLSSSEIKYLINTHWHGDHTGGNEAFAKMGATIVAHDNVRERLSHKQIRPFGKSAEAAPEQAWPRLTFNEKMNVHINGESIQLIHHHHAHTDGDAFVYFPSYNVLHMGDCFFKNRFPFVDVDMGGTPDGIIEAVAGALMLADEDTKIIPGHGTLSTKQDLSDYQQMLLIMRSRVKKELDNGVSQKDLNYEELTKGYAAWGDGFISGEKYVKMLYNFYTEE